MVVQFGELDYRGAPNRTARYVMTARKAFHELGVKDPGEHMIVSPYITNSSGDLSTIMLKRTPFTAGGGRAVRDRAGQGPAVADVVGAGPAAGRGHRGQARRRTGRRTCGRDRRRPTRTGSTRSSDDGPFFWHFSGFGDVLSHYFDPITAGDPELLIGERVLILLLGFAVLYAADLPARAVLLRAPRVAGAAGEADLGALLRRARARVHLLRDHDDPAAGAVPRVPDLLADGHARVDCSCSPGSARC